MQRTNIINAYDILCNSFHINIPTNIIRIIKARRVRWAGHVVCMGERKNVYKVFVGKPEGKRTLGRLRHIRDDNIKMDLWGCGLGSSDAG
jgi:hypothetical protein